MSYYIIIETEDGQVVVNCNEGDSPTVVAEKNGGLLVDEGRFDSFETAMDRLAELEPDEQEG